MNVPLTLREVTRPEGPAWEAWQRIYLDSFPPEERMSEAFFVRRFEERAAGQPDSEWQMLLADAPGDPAIGIAYVEESPDCRLMSLWYLAVRAGRRSQGIGADLYREIVRHAAAREYPYLVFEVERPEAGGEWAQRRIEWYRRQGARLVEGITYYQSVDTGLLPLRMDLMVHSIDPIRGSDDAESVMPLLERCYGNSLTRTGPARLV